MADAAAYLDSVSILVHFLAYLVSDCLIPIHTVKEEIFVGNLIS